MSKDVNIHVKTTGAEFTKEQLQAIKDHVARLGYETSIAGSKAEKASNGFGQFFNRFKGPLGVIAAISGIARLALAIEGFFDKIKQRSDEAVRELQQVRGGFDDIFEALNAFDEKSRQAATKETYQLLQKTGTPEAIGLPIVNAYIRQFKDQMPPDQYQQGLEAMLSYGARHGKGATAELIEFMGGLGMNQPDQQAAFTRQIAAASQAVKLPDEAIISAMSKGMSTIKAMGWTPEQALEAVATMAATAGPNVKMRTTMPTAGLQAIMAPQAPEKLAYAEVEAAEQAKDAAEKAKAQAKETRTFAAKKAADLAQADAEAKEIAAEQAVTAAQKLAEDPMAFMWAVKDRRAAMTREQSNRFLREIYGEQGGLAVGGLLEGRKDLARKIQWGKTAEGLAADRAEEERFKSTLEFRDAVTKAADRGIQQDVTDEEKTMEDVRDLGLEAQKKLRIRQPWRQEIRERLSGKAREQEEAARRYWIDYLTEHLTEEQKRNLRLEYKLDEDRPPLGSLPETIPLQSILAWKWKKFTPQQRWQSLTTIRLSTDLPAESPPAIESPPPGLEPPPEAQQAEPNRVVSYNYDHRVIHQTIFNPVVGMNKQDLRIEPPYLA